LFLIPIQCRYSAEKQWNNKKGEKNVQAGNII